MQAELGKEEEEVGKIRELIKERTKSRNIRRGPPPKRRKVNDNTYNMNESRQENPKIEPEKRKVEELQNLARKKSRTKDIREAFLPK